MVDLRPEENKEGVGAEEQQAGQVKQDFLD